MNVHASTEKRSALSADTLSSMFQSIEGLKNLRAAAAMAGCFVGAVLLVGLMTALFSRSSGMLALGALLAAAIVFAGVHAAGSLLMDQANGAPPRGIVDAVVYGLWCVPKTLGLLLCLALALLALYLVMALVLFICKMPGVGPVLYTVAFPVMIVAAGISFMGLYMAFALALAAFWAGAGVVSAVAEAVNILRHRLVETVLLLIVVNIIAAAVGAVVGMTLLAGLLPVSGLSAAILDFGFGGLAPMLSMGGMGGMGTMGGGMGGMGGGSGGGYMLAGAIGGGVLWALAVTLVFQVALMGLNLVYLRVREGLDASAAEQAMRDRLDEAKRKAAEVGQRAKEAAERARVQAEQAAAARRSAHAAAAPVAPTAQAQSAISNCPKCSAAVTPDDGFCGGCGFKLR